MHVVVYMGIYIYVGIGVYIEVCREIVTLLHSVLESDGTRSFITHNTHI